MKLTHYLRFLVFLLVSTMLYQLASVQPVQAEEAAQEAKDENEDKDVEKAAPKQQANQAEAEAEKPKPEQVPQRKRRSFLPRAPIQGLPTVRPKQLTKPVTLIRQPASANMPTRQPAAPKALPANPQPNAPIWAPQRGLSSAATYQLYSMGRHVQLNPATRWRLDQANAGARSTMPGQPLSSAATLPGEGAEKFYPGVSRLPPQKPFANVQPEPTGLQRYWPLLLEGREDPNTGLIIWTLP